MPNEETDLSSSESEDYIPYEEVKDFKRKIKPKLNVMTPELGAALDRTNISDRNATFVVAAVVSSLGIDVGTVNINRETIRVSRRKIREESAKKIKEDFTVCSPLTVHWDGKLLKDRFEKFAFLTVFFNLFLCLKICHG